MSARLERVFTADSGSSATIAACAVRALRAEALLTPKPGLVDQRGSGAHHDLDLDRVLRSADSLREPFASMAACASGRSPCVALREDLGRIGREGESAMLLATGGSNAHRGAIWVLGLLVAARAMSASTEFATVTTVAELAASIARFPDRYAPAEATHGSRVRLRFGATGARGEACAGFPHVTAVGLPALWAARRRGIDEGCARLDALMAIMAELQDTCVLYRGGHDAQVAVQTGARRVLDCGGTSTVAGRLALRSLDRALLARWVSPGGSADLLAACLFLDEMANGSFQSSISCCNGSATFIAEAS
jgi:triphosphoribosyl-dephospho-CoA synthase